MTPTGLPLRRSRVALDERGRIGAVVAVIDAMGSATTMDLARTLVAFNGSTAVTSEGCNRVTKSDADRGRDVVIFDGEGRRRLFRVKHARTAAGRKDPPHPRAPPSCNHFSRR